MRLYNVASLDTAGAEITSVASLSSRVRDPLHHAVYSFPVGEAPGDEVGHDIAEHVLRRHGFDLDAWDGHQAMTAVHRDREHVHVHAMANRVSQRDGKALPLEWKHKTTHRALREMELKHNLTRGRGPIEIQEVAGKAFLRDVTRTSGDSHQVAGRSTGARDAVYHGKQASFQGWMVDEVRPNLREAVNTDKSWASLHTAAASHGVELERQGGGLRFVDAASDQYAAKASQVGRDFSRKRLESRLGPYEEPDRAVIEQARENALDHGYQVATEKARSRTDRIERDPAVERSARTATEERPSARETGKNGGVAKGEQYERINAAAPRDLATESRRALARFGQESSASSDERQRSLREYRALSALDASLRETTTTSPRARQELTTARVVVAERASRESVTEYEREVRTVGAQAEVERFHSSEARLVEDGERREDAYKRHHDQAREHIDKSDFTGEFKEEDRTGLRRGAADAVDARFGVAEIERSEGRGTGERDRDDDETQEATTTQGVSSVMSRSAEEQEADKETAETTAATRSEERSESKDPSAEVTSEKDAPSRTHQPEAGEGRTEARSSEQPPEQQQPAQDEQTSERTAQPPPRERGAAAKLAESQQPASKESGQAEQKPSGQGQEVEKTSAPSQQGGSAPEKRPAEASAGGGQPAQQQPTQEGEQAPSQSQGASTGADAEVQQAQTDEATQGHDPGQQPSQEQAPGPAPPEAHGSGTSFAGNDDDNEDEAGEMRGSNAERDDSETADDERRSGRNGDEANVKPQQPAAGSGGGGGANSPAADAEEDEADEEKGPDSEQEEEQRRRRRHDRQHRDLAWSALADEHAALAELDAAPLTALASAEGYEAVDSAHDPTGGGWTAMEGPSGDQVLIVHDPQGGDDAWAPAGDDPASVPELRGIDELVTHLTGKDSPEAVADHLVGFASAQAAEQADGRETDATREAPQEQVHESATQTLTAGHGLSH